MTRILVLALTLSLQILAVSAAESPTPEALLAQLRAKDAAFDNVKLEYVNSGKIIAEPGRVGFDVPRPRMPPAVRQPNVIPFRRFETLVVRGSAVTYFSTVDPDSGSPQSRERISAFYKHSNANGLMRSSDRGHSPHLRANATMEIRKGDDRGGVCREHAMAVKFAHGFGFGERIKTIERVEPADEMLRVTGTIQIWWEDDSAFELLVDDRRLVRSATIESNVHGNCTRFETTTYGEAKSGAFEFAATGTFRRTALGRLTDGELASTPKVLTEFRSEFRSCEHPLSDEGYANLIAMPEEPGMQIWDWVNNVTYFSGETRRKLRE